MSVRKGCELTPMTRLVSRLCSRVRLLTNGMLTNSVRRLQIGGKFATYFRQRLSVAVVCRIIVFVAALVSNQWQICNRKADFPQNASTLKYLPLF